MRALSYSKVILGLAFIPDKIRQGETKYITAKIISELLDIKSKRPDEPKNGVIKTLNIVKEIMKTVLNKTTLKNILDTE